MSQSQPVRYNQPTMSIFFLVYILMFTFFFTQLFVGFAGCCFRDSLWGGFRWPASWTRFSRPTTASLVARSSRTSSASGSKCKVCASPQTTNKLIANQPRFPLGKAHILPFKRMAKVRPFSYPACVLTRPSAPSQRDTQNLLVHRHLQVL